MTPSANQGSGAPTPLATWFLGVWIAVVTVKFGNPVIFSQLLPPPESFLELFFNSWPISWSYGALGILLVAAALLGRGPCPTPRWLLVLPMVWFGWTLLSATQTVDQGLTRLTIAHFAGCIACFYVGAFTLRQVRDWRPVYAGLVVGMTFIMATALDQHFGGLERARQAFAALTVEERAGLDTPEFRKKILSDRVFGTFVYPNALAGGLLLLLPLALASVRVLGARRETRWLLGGWLAAGGLAALYWSGSKSGWLIALVMAGVALWRLPAKFSLKATVVSCLVMLGVALFLGRYGAYFEKGASSLAARGDYWRAAGQMIQQRPLLGYGPGTFQRQYSALKPPEAEMAKLAHNDYFQQGCDSGLPAMLAYGAFMAGAILLLYRRSASSPLHFAAWLGVFGFAVQGLTEFGLYIPGLAWPFFLMLGWLIAQPLNEIDKPPAPF